LNEELVKQRSQQWQEIKSYAKW